MPGRLIYSTGFIGVVALLMSACVQAPTDRSAATATPATTDSQNPAQGTSPQVVATHKPPSASALFGLKGDDLVPLFGQPALRRDDGRAQIWRYQGDACQLYLFLYQPKSGGTFSIRHLESVRLSNREKTSEPADTAETEACIDGLWRRKNQPPTS